MGGKKLLRIGSDGRYEMMEDKKRWETGNNRRQEVIGNRK